MFQCHLIASHQNALYRHGHWQSQNELKKLWNCWKNQNLHWWSLEKVRWRLCCVFYNFGWDLLFEGAASARAEQPIRRFLHLSGLPFLPTPMGKGVVPDDHQQCVAAARSMWDLQWLPVWCSLVATLAAVELYWNQTQFCCSAHVSTGSYTLDFHHDSEVTSSWFRWELSKRRWIFSCWATYAGVPIFRWTYRLKN